MRTHVFLAAWLVLAPACTDGSATDSNGASGGSAGAGGSASTGGSAGTSGATGSGGTTSSGGTTGTGGTSGDAGASGTASGGSATGGSAGAGMSGSSGMGAGDAGSGGAAGSGGTGGSPGGNAGRGGAGGANALMNFFVTSDTSMTGDLDGLMGADARCQGLAAAVGAGNKTWRAYLSVAAPPTNARDRIGEGPYYNSQGMLLAMTKDALHARSGDVALFVDEHGARINGQWAGSPTPNQHDVLTGSTAMGMISTGNTCGDWNSTSGMSFVGHTDGLGPGMSSAAPYNQWAGAHTGQCGDTAPGGGAGRLYCFVGP